jgi:hypothetical protein
VRNFRNLVQSEVAKIALNDHQGHLEAMEKQICFLAELVGALYDALPQQEDAVRILMQTTNLLSIEDW